MPDGTSSTLHEIKISELPVATAANATDQLEANQAGTTRSITVGQIGSVLNLTGYATITGTLTPGNVATVTATGIIDSGVQLISTLPATTLWGNNTSSTSPPAALTRTTLGNGTAAAPSYSFNASAGTGIYSSGANQINVAVAGNNFLQMRASNATSFMEILYSSGGLVRMQGGTNVDMTVAGNGTGNVYLMNNGATGNSVLFRVAGPATAGGASNYLLVKPGDGAGNNPNFTPVVQGTADTNVGIDFLPVGTGAVRCQNNFFHSRYNGSIGAGSTTQCFVKGSSTADLGIYYGTGDPAFSAAKGSLYTKTDATTTTTRLWVNTNGSTTWASFTASA